VRLIVKDLPLASHDQARPAAEAARCAAAEGRYWPYHDRLFAEQPRFAEDRLIAYAVELGLDGSAFARCLTERRFAREVQADVAQARALGIRSTPTFLINGRTLVGAHPVEAFRTMVDDALQRRQSHGPSSWSASRVAEAAPRVAEAAPRVAEPTPRAPGAGRPGAI
jgi:protein-disulfide isomerase